MVVTSISGGGGGYQPEPHCVGVGNRKEDDEDAKMPKRYFRLLPCLLLSLQSAWTAVRVTVPALPIQARPGSDVHLPCDFIDTASLIHLKELAVKWTVGGQIVAKYDDGLKANRPGAVMTAEQLQAGNATLLLPGINDGEAGIYTCFVIHSPNKGEGNVELRVEAPPRLTLGSTKLQLAKPGAVTCTASDFYPSKVSVTWLRDGETVKTELPLVQSGPHGLFYAESVLKLTPQITDVNATFSCHVHHQATEEPIREDFKLRVQATPVLQVLTRPRENNFLVAECLVSGFYPREVQVQWLQDGVPQTKVESAPQRLPNGTFSMQSIVWPQESNTKVSYVCQVEHDALNEPLEETVLWQPKGAFRSHLPWLLGLIGLILGLVLGGGAGILYHTNKVKHEQALKSEETPLKKNYEEPPQRMKAKTEKPNDFCNVSL
ncbi:tyrosine-protein phosphatase non-receptor type substrate 1-like [Rhineura floridana]|uniref:tyrosine-protein phosphatase non-receptor type substrate 1-like n=1 Tax=Rhineura floridana TaxID=261503 RepID=UPI002AC809A1|nr:tyrosine-protein phosphatase non-receptor type substrate 1-like [Rhineura floridana]